MKRRAFLSKAASGAAAFAIAPGVFTTSEPAFAASSPRLEHSAATWHERPLRLYHPNARAFEMESLDVKPFIADCRATGAEAVVVSAGGIYAFYPSKVKYHRVSPMSGKRDLLGETVLEARRQNLKVIARVDFSRARADVFNDHPEWFRRDAQEQPVSQGADYYSTCTLAGYRNEGFAYDVIREIQALYRVHGFHLNAGAFPTCHCRTCVNAYGGLLPADEKTTDPAAWRQFLQWRREAHSKQLAGYYRVMCELDAESFFMAELFLNREYHIPTLARHKSFSQLLFTAGELHRERGSTQDARLDVALTSDHGRAVAGTRPLINIKMQMRSLRLSQSYMPSAEFFYGAYQALAHDGPIPLTVPYREVTPATRAHVWYGDAHSEDAIPEDIEELTVGTDPVVLFTHAGEGSVVYVATGLGQMIQRIGHVDYITMLDSFVYHDLAKPRPLVTTAPSTVTVTSARWQDGDVVHLVNGTGPSPLDAVIPLGPIELDLAWSGPARAELVVPGEPAQALPVRLTPAGRLVMTVPLLGAYAQVVVRRSEA